MLTNDPVSHYMLEEDAHRHRKKTYTSKRTALPRLTDKNGSRNRVIMIKMQHINNAIDQQREAPKRP